MSKRPTQLDQRSRKPPLEVYSKKNGTEGSLHSTDKGFSEQEAKEAIPLRRRRVAVEDGDAAAAVRKRRRPPPLASIDGKGVAAGTSEQVHNDTKRDHSEVNEVNVSSTQGQSLVEDSESSRDYEVGYGKPPKATQFRKGQSGNSRGRPKRARNVSTLARKELMRMVSITENGRTKRVSAFEVYLKRLNRDAVAGKPQAMRIVMDLAERHLQPEPIAEVGTSLSAENEALLADFIGLAGVEPDAPE